MRMVIQRTGLSADVLRAWEKRYGVVEPRRSEGGQRLYSDEDVERLALLRRATAGGRNISLIAGLGVPELERLIAEDESGRVEAADAPAARHAAASWYLGACVRAIVDLDAVHLEALLRRAVLQLSATTAIDDVVLPLLKEVGERWHQGALTPAHEHLGSAVIRRVLTWMADAAAMSPGAPVVVVATPATQRHELGAKIVSTTASHEGWRVVFLGSDLPADAIAAAALQSGASLVALSLIFPTDEASVTHEVLALRRLLPPSVTIVVGGAAVASYGDRLAEAGVRVLPDLPQLRVLLRALHPSPPAHAAVSK